MWVAPQQWKFLKIDSTSKLVRRGGLILFERIAFLEKNNKLIQPLLAQPSSSQHQQQQPQRPHNFLPFLRPQNSIQTKKRERKFKEVNQCQTSTTRQQVSTPVLGVLCRSLYIDKANSIGTISSRRGSQRGGKWEAMDMFLRNFRPGSSSTRNKSKRTQILTRKGFQQDALLL